MTTTDRVDLLRTMLLIRRFEEACAELYSASRIRGFLHLYVGEEAVATGLLAALGPDDAVLTTYREHGHALARGIPADVDHGRDVRATDRLQPRPGRVDAPLRRRAALRRRQRHRRRRHPDGRRDGARRPPARPRPGDRVLLRRGRDGRGRVPRVDEPRRAVAPAGAVLLREQPLRDGHGDPQGARGHRPGPAGRVLRRDGVAGRRDGRARGRRRGAARGGGDPRRRRAALPGAAHLPVPRPLDVRLRPVPRQGGDRRVEAARPDRRPGVPHAGRGAR